MIKQKHLIACIEDLNRDKHVMESGEFVHNEIAYQYKIKKLKKKVTIFPRGNM